MADDGLGGRPETFTAGGPGMVCDIREVKGLGGWAFGVRISYMSEFFQSSGKSVAVSSDL